MDLREQLYVLRKRWLTVLLVLVLSVAAAGVGSSLVTRKFTASTQLFFGVRGGANITDLTQGSSYIQQQMASYVRVATSPLVLKPVIAQLGLTVRPADLAKHVMASAPMDTVILEVDVTDPDAEQAARIANAIAAEVVSVAGQLVPAESDSVQPVRATVLAEAEVPDDSSSPDLLLNLALALAIGLAAGVGVALLRDALNTRVRTEADVASLTSAAVLGQIPLEATPRNDALGVLGDVRGTRAEAVRRLRTNFQFVELARSAKTILVTSSIAGEGKTTTFLELGQSLAASGLRVVLVDADLRNPAVAGALGLGTTAGLSTVLVGQTSLGDDVLHRVDEGSFDVLPAGPVPPNPTELLGSQAMLALLNQLSARYDLVLLDSPPILPVSDALVLSQLVDGSMLVVDADRLSRRQLREALEALETLDVDLLGVVLNKVPRRSLSTYASPPMPLPDWHLPPSAPSESARPTKSPSARATGAGADADASRGASR